MVIIKIIYKKNLSGQFDLKYWPRTDEVVEAIGVFAQEAEIYENDYWTEELVSSPKHSMADYLRVILKAIEDRKQYGPYSHLLPPDFRISDDVLAIFINCTLDLEPSEVLSTDNIKRSRQNIRNGKKRIKGNGNLL